ncbi:MAG: hypothetical protein QOG00_243 [Pyrinomonadaceae bacterium]|nr:hypothetical protein [Pyrinomonadaceae bacterium]
MSSPALAHEAADGLHLRIASALPTEDELDSVNEQLAKVNLELAAVAHLKLDLGDRREQLLSRRAEILRRPERDGLFEEGEPINFYDLEHVGPAEPKDAQ